MDNFKFLRKKRVIIAILFLSFLTFVVLEIWALNRLSGLGERIVKIEEASSQLKRENEILENKIAEEASLKKVEEKVKPFGFKSYSSIQYLKLALN